MGNVGVLPFRKPETAGADHHVDDARHGLNARVDEHAEVFVLVSVGRLHDERGERLGPADVGG